MKEFKYIITDSEGIHARPAGILVKKASGFDCAVRLIKDGKEVDAKRIMSVMTLGVKSGTEITVRCDGEGEDAAIAELEDFFKENL